MQIFESKKILVTGHTGFKGAWLAQWLEFLGADVYGYALPPEQKCDLYNILELESKITSIFGDLRDYDNLQKTINDIKPDIIFHLGAQSLVRRSYKNPVETFATNLIGTVNLLEAARQCDSVKAIVNITTDKCYENKETGEAFIEDNPMGGHDPYSASKACVEIASNAYRNSFLKDCGIAMATARAGNVIGGGDFSEDRIIPDAIRAIEDGESLVIRSPNSIRPWQHVFDVLNGYLMLGASLLDNGNEFAKAYNFAPDDKSSITVNEIVTKLYDNIGMGKVIIDQSRADLHEAKNLCLDASRAKKELGWSPRLTIDESIKMTADWYGQYINSKNGIKGFAKSQLEEYSL